MKDYGLHWSALGFGKETTMSYFCKIINIACANACALHLVQLKWTYCHIIAWEFRMRWLTVIIACIDLESY